MVRERRLVLFGWPTIVGLKLAAPCIVSSYGEGGGGVTDVLVSAGMLSLRARLSLVVIPVLTRWAQTGTGAHGGALDNGEAGHGGLVGAEAQVQASLVGKCGMTFSGVHSSSAAHFLVKEGWHDLRLRSLCTLPP